MNLSYLLQILLLSFNLSARLGEATIVGQSGVIRASAYWWCKPRRIRSFLAQIERLPYRYTVINYVDECLPSTKLSVFLEDTSDGGNESADADKIELDSFGSTAAMHARMKSFWGLPRKDPKGIAQHLEVWMESHLGDDFRDVAYYFGIASAFGWLASLTYRRIKIRKDSSKL